MNEIKMKLINKIVGATLRAGSIVFRPLAVIIIVLNSPFDYITNSLLLMVGLLWTIDELIKGDTK